MICLIPSIQFHNSITNSKELIHQYKPANILHNWLLTNPKKIKINNAHFLVHDSMFATRVSSVVFFIVITELTLHVTLWDMLHSRVVPIRFLRYTIRTVYHTIHDRLLTVQYMRCVCIVDRITNLTSAICACTLVNHFFRSWNFIHFCGHSRAKYNVISITSRTLVSKASAYNSFTQPCGQRGHLSIWDLTSKVVCIYYASPCRLQQDYTGLLTLESEGGIL